MELMFIALLGAIMGLAARYVLPHRHTHGVVLMPAVGVIAAAVIWEVFTWLGFKWDAGVIWWIAVLGTAFVLAAVGILTGQLRTRSDDRLFDRLSKGAPASAN
jgi:hypothetical protein